MLPVSKSLAVPFAKGEEHLIEGAVHEGHVVWITEVEREGNLGQLVIDVEARLAGREGE